MGLQPKIEKKKGFSLKTCPRCGQSFGPEGFAPTKSIFFPDGVLPICNDCVDKFIEGDIKDPEDAGNWRRVNKLCQMSDIPFVPKEWQKLYDMDRVGAFGRYAMLFMGSEFEDLGWGEYFNEFKALKEENRIKEELPELDEKRLKEQKERWGGNYDQEALNYLDTLFNGLLSTQNVNGALQMDQAIKICKLSYEIDCKIREGAEFDKTLAAYDKLVKAAEFTPKNVKNVNDFDSIGELIRWEEKRGWRNKYFDGVSRDIVDETIKNIQSFNQRLYTNESGIGDDITHRIEMLKSASSLTQDESEGYFLDQSQEYDLDKYENDGYNELIKGEVFDPTAGGFDG